MTTDSRIVGVGRIDRDENGEGEGGRGGNGEEEKKVNNKIG